MKLKKKNANAGILYEQTGISQQALSQYIGAKRSTLTHHLAGTRLLAGEAGLKLVNLIVQLAELPPPTSSPTLSAQEKAELKEGADDCRYKCLPLQKRLDGMQKEAAQAVRMLQWLNVLEKEDTDISEARQRWYESQRYTAQTRLGRSGVYQQTLLQAKITALQKEAEMYEALLVDQ